VAALVGSNLTYNLLYRGSEHGFRASYFHAMCDNKGKSLSIVKTDQGIVFGGYTNIPWKS